MSSPRAIAPSNFELCTSMQTAGVWMRSGMYGNTLISSEVTCASIVSTRACLIFASDDMSACRDPATTVASQLPGGDTVVADVVDIAELVHASSAERRVLQLERLGRDDDAGLTHSLRNRRPAPLGGDPDDSLPAVIDRQHVRDELDLVVRPADLAVHHAVPGVDLIVGGGHHGGERAVAVGVDLD